MNEEVIYSEVKFIKKEELHGENQNGEKEASTVHAVCEVNVHKDDNQQIHQSGNAKSDSKSNSHCAFMVLVALCGLLLAALIAFILLYFSNDKEPKELALLSMQSENKSVFSNLHQELQECHKNISDKLSNCYRACPKTWLFYDGKCYFFSEDVFNWTESRDSCISTGGHLAIINSRNEQEFLMSIKSQMNEDKFWIGLTDVQNESQWLWVDNTPLHEQNRFWIENEPDNWTGEDQTDEDCACMGVSSPDDSLRGWYDNACVKLHKRICETLSSV